MGREEERHRKGKIDRVRQREREREETLYGERERERETGWRGGGEGGCVGRGGGRRREIWRKQWM